MSTVKEGNKLDPNPNSVVQKNATPLIVSGPDGEEKNFSYYREESTLCIGEDGHVILDPADMYMLD